MKPEVFLPDDYRPAEDEPFMNDRQLEYFKRKLLIWKADLMSDSKETIEGLQDSTRNIPDIADRASEETCLLYTSPSPRDGLLSRMPSSA